MPSGGVLVVGDVGGRDYVEFMEITIVEGDITAQDVDAVVNAANRAMRGLSLIHI